MFCWFMYSILFVCRTMLATWSDEAMLTLADVRPDTVPTVPAVFVTMGYK